MMEEEIEAKPSTGIYLDNSRVISILLAMVSVGLMAFCGVLWTDEQQMRADFNSYVLSKAQADRDYLKRDDLVEVNQRLQRMEDKIDRMAGRSP